MRLIPSLVTSAVLAISFATTAVAKPPLRDVAEIDNGLMAIAIADEIRKSCKGIEARKLYAASVIFGLQSKAKSLGYSSGEIDAYVNSKSEKARMRDKAETYLASQGVDADSNQQLCAFGKSEIKAKTAIGALLR